VAGDQSAHRPGARNVGRVLSGRIYPVVAAWHCRGRSGVAKTRDSSRADLPMHGVGKAGVGGALSTACASTAQACRACVWRWRSASCRTAAQPLGNESSIARAWPCRWSPPWPVAGHRGHTGSAMAVSAGTGQVLQSWPWRQLTSLLFQNDRSEVNASLSSSVKPPGRPVLASRRRKRQGRFLVSTPPSRREKLCSVLAREPTTNPTHPRPGLVRAVWMSP
jgi:hypothetical protein